MSELRGKVVCIGPNTAAALTKEGLKADIVAREHTIPGLVEAIAQYFQYNREESV